MPFTTHIAEARPRLPAAPTAKRSVGRRFLVLVLAAAFCVLAKADLGAQTAHLLLVDQSASAHSDEAYKYARAAVFEELNARAAAGDDVRVYAVHARTRAVAPLRQLTVAPKVPSAEALAGKGGKTQQAIRDEAAKGFKRANFGVVKVAHAATQASPAEALTKWTDLLGAFELAADRYADGATAVRVSAWTDGVHSMPGRDYAARPLTDKAGAEAAAKADVAALREEYELSSFRESATSLTLYFPRGGAADQRAAMRYYWRAFGAGLGLGEVSFVE